MTHKTEKELKPKLRFPEFQAEPGWPSSLGDKLFNTIKNRKAAPGLPVLAITQEHGAIPRDMIDYHVSVTEKSVDTYKEVLVGDFIISLRSFQGGIEYSNYHGICSPAYVILRKTTELSDDYFKQFFKTHRFICQLTKNLEGLRDGKMISYKQFSELLIPTPSPAEQTRIAECLSSLDELIAAHGRKLEALKAYKKGLMQNLFPRPGESQPRLRFPEFREDGDWEPNDLDKVALVVNQKTTVSSLAIDEYISTENILPDFQGVGLATRLPTVKNATWYHPGDTLFANIRPYLKKAWFATKSGGASNDVIVFRSKGKIEPHFLSLHIRNDAFVNYVMKSSKGLKMPRGDVSQMKLYTISLPKRKEEQQEIVNLLNSIDDHVLAQSKKVNALSQHKKGLMQQLFPSLEEDQA